LERLVYVDWVEIQVSSPVPCSITPCYLETPLFSSPSQASRHGNSTPYTEDFETVEEGQWKLGLFDVWQNGCPNRGLEGRSPAEAYGRPIGHSECVEAFYRLYLGEAPPRL